MKQKELIIRLIVDDLINTRLFDHFQTVGFYFDGYHLNLSDTIFKLMKIEDKNDELFELYLNKCSELSKKCEIVDRFILKEYAEEIYSFLIQNR